MIDQRYAKELEGFSPKADPSSGIRLTSYRANDLKYEASATSEQLAVFSEIYFNDGWNAYIDGKVVPHFCADWTLRALRVPAGKHEIEFKFEPTRYYTGEKISLASCILLFASLLAALYFGWRNKSRDIKTS